MPKLGNRTDFTDLKNRKVFGSKDQEVGRIIDFVVNDKFEVTKLILGGSRIEELRERIGLKPDDDPVLPVEQLGEPTSEGNYKLSHDGDKLQSKLEEGVISKNEYMFSNLRKLDVKSNDNNSIGKIVDAIFCEDDSICFVLGDSRFVEFLERIGIAGNYDLLLPASEISKIEDDKIVINKTKDELKIILDNQDVQGIKVNDYKAAKIAELQSGVTRYKYATLR